MQIWNWIPSSTLHQIEVTRETGILKVGKGVMGKQIKLSIFPYNPSLLSMLQVPSDQSPA